MRTLRMLCLVLAYIFTVPVGLLFTVGLFTYLCIKNAKEFGETFYEEVLKVFVEGLKEGLKEGHKANMEWVETGKRKIG